MQFNRYIALPKSSLFYHRLFFIFRIIAFLVLVYFLWQAFLANQKAVANLESFRVSWPAENLLLMLGVVLMLPLNWLLEALKWQLIASNSNISLGQAVKGVILGLTLDNILPAGSGAISGRILTVENKEKIKILPGILVGQIVQTVVTFLFGLIGFSMVWEKESTMFHWQLSHTLMVSGVALVILLALVFWRQRLRIFLKPLKEYNFTDLLLVIILSVGRYLVFLIQFILLATIFTSTLSIGVIIGCATWVFAARTFMPKISNIERLGIRALAVLFFMNLFNLSFAGMMVTVVSLWFINLLIPSIIGLVMLKNLKTSSIFN